MRAAILEKLNSPLTVREVELTELKVGQVLVKVLVSGLCGSQLHEICGHKGNAKFLPHLMGHEGCGIVEQIGPGVTTVKIGDKVVMHWRIGEGIEAPFPEYILDGQKISSGKVTTLSEYSIVSENRLTSVPSDTPDELCALLGCSLTTALGIIDNETDLKFGESVAIVGCGGIGLNLIQGAVLRGAFPIIGIDTAEFKREKSLSIGATFFLNPLKENLKLSNIDVVIDTTGNVSIIGEMTKYLSPNGRMILVSPPSPNKFLNIPNVVNLFGGKGKIIKATQGGKTNPTEDIPRYIKMSNAGILDIKSVITHIFELSDINKAFDVLRSGQAGRVMIRIKEDVK
jgi:Zn-dependent alcohol dehydrogenase